MEKLRRGLVFVARWCLWVVSAGVNLLPNDMGEEATAMTYFAVVFGGAFIFGTTGVFFEEFIFRPFCFVAYFIPGVLLHIYFKRELGEQYHLF